MNTHHHPNRAMNQKELEARRLKAVPYFKRGSSERHIGRKLGVSSIAVHQWKEIWKEKGMKGLKSRRYGHPSKLSGAEEKEVRKKILEGALVHGFPGDYWTISRVTGAGHAQGKNHFNT